MFMDPQPAIIPHALAYRANALDGGGLACREVDIDESAIRKPITEQFLQNFSTPFACGVKCYDIAYAI